MLLGSNNTMTYLSPSNWWAKIFRFIGKCQNLNYEDQYKYQGVRLFDIRLYVSPRNKHIVARNGKILYDLFSLFNVFSFFNKMGDVTVRVSLDITMEERMCNNDYDAIKTKFISTCNMLETVYPDIMYIGGYKTYDKSRLYTFKYEKEHGEPLIIDECNRKWYDWVFPFIVARKNREMIERYENEHGFLLLNFVEKR